MKTILLAIGLVVSIPAFAETYICKADSGSLQQNVVVRITTEAFHSPEYSGAARVSIEGAHDSFMNVKDKEVYYIRLENNSEIPVFIVPLEFKGDGLIYIVFEDEGQHAQLRYENADEEEVLLAKLSCKD